MVPKFFNFHPRKPYQMHHLMRSRLCQTQQFGNDLLSYFPHVNFHLTIWHKIIRLTVLSPSSLWFFWAFSTFSEVILLQLVQRTVRPVTSLGHQEGQKIF